MLLDVNITWWFDTFINNSYNQVTSIQIVSYYSRLSKTKTPKNNSKQRKSLLTNPDIKLTLVSEVENTNFVENGI